MSLGNRGVCVFRLSEFAIWATAKYPHHVRMVMVENAPCSRRPTEMRPIARNQLC